MDLARRRIDIRLPEDLLARVDAEAERLGQTRTKFLERALESALGASSPAGSSPVPAMGSQPDPAPSRAPGPRYAPKRAVAPIPKGKGK
jgi:hypothetical protein